MALAKHTVITTKQDLATDLKDSQYMFHLPQHAVTVVQRRNATILLQHNRVAPV